MKILKCLVVSLAATTVSQAQQLSSIDSRPVSPTWSELDFLPIGTLFEIENSRIVFEWDGVNLTIIRDGEPLELDPDETMIDKVTGNLLFLAYPLDSGASNDLGYIDGELSVGGPALNVTTLEFDLQYIDGAVRAERWTRHDSRPDGDDEANNWTIIFADRCDCPDGSFDCKRKDCDTITNCGGSQGYQCKLYPVVPIVIISRP